MRLKWCREWHLSPKPHIEWTMRSWKNIKFNLKNSSPKDTLNLTNRHIGHPSFLFTRKMGRWGCVWIIEPSTRWRWKINTHYFRLMIFLIDSWELKCLVGSTYVWGVTKFELRKGMNKRLFVTQGMAHTNSWWCLLGSLTHPPHFALSWITFPRNDLMTLSSSST
jgi:hypothetical protein